MTDFIFAQQGLRYTNFSLPKETGKRTNIAGFDSYKTGGEVLQRSENYTLCAVLNGLYKTIPLKSSNPIPGFLLASYKNLFNVPRSAFHVPRSEFHVPRSVFRVPCSAFRVPRSTFRVPCSAFRVPCSTFRVPCSVFRVRGLVIIGF